MMLFEGFKSKKELQDVIKKQTIKFMDHAIETSMFGPEYRNSGTYTVCMDHPRRTKFANISVNHDGDIVGVK